MLVIQLAGLLASGISRLVADGPPTAAHLLTAHLLTTRPPARPAAAPPQAVSAGSTAPLRLSPGGGGGGGGGGAPVVRACEGSAEGGISRRARSLARGERDDRVAVDRVA